MDMDLSYEGFLRRQKLASTGDLSFESGREIPGSGSVSFESRRRFGTLFDKHPDEKGFYMTPKRGWYVSVEGYDTSLPAEEIKEALFKHFRPCGPIGKVYFEETDPPNRRAILAMIGEADEDAKALELNGSEAVGGILVVQAKPPPQLKFKDVPFN